MDKFLNLCGLCRRAGKLGIGHDAAISCIVKEEAALCIITSSASQRLEKEIRHACCYGDKSITVLKVRYTMPEITQAIGIKAAVLTVNDEGFAHKLLSLYEAFDNISERVNG